MTQPSRIDGLPDLPKPGAMTCTECGMLCEWREFHPFAACLMFKGCHDSDKVRANLNAVREAGSAAAAQAAKQVPAGFVLVPREPTRAMWLAAEKLLKGPNNAYRIWEDMIAAAPSATSLAEAAEAGQVEAAAWRDVRAERLRQINAEGWTPKRDDEHDNGGMAQAAACYASHASVGPELRKRDLPRDWPWAPKWWKPGDQRRMLVKAGALILAEIERLDRINGDTQ
jgi:hypothetical protein